MLLLASGCRSTSSRKTLRRDIYRPTLILKKTSIKTPSCECIAVAPGVWTHHKTSHLRSSNRADAQTVRQGSVRRPDLGLNVRPPEEAEVILGHHRQILAQVDPAVAHDMPKDRVGMTSPSLSSSEFTFTGDEDLFTFIDGSDELSTFTDGEDLN